MKELSTPLLDRINSPQDLRALPESELPDLCTELRDYLIDTVSKTAGHLASGLAAVELAVALHYVFDTPNDKLVWDVGHQAYPHKILTGHKRELKTIRRRDGLHAFIWRGETPYDLLTTGHASTSVGSALGLAMASKYQGLQNRTVAVIGDGALSGGAAYEALNNAGAYKDLNLLVILNDNEMSISHNVGAVASGLNKILANPHYVKLVKGGEQVLRKLPAIRDFAMRAQEHVKGMVMPGTLFEELGFHYSGPVNGHDVRTLIAVLRNLRELGGLQFLHVFTKKGKGYAPAEQDPTGYHGVPVFDPDLGIQENPKQDQTFSAGFGRWICDCARDDPKLAGITPAMRVGSAMNDFAKRFPKQFYDVGIAEQHAMIFASGLAAGGLHPVVNMYSTFLQRAYDGVIHDFALQDLPMLLAVDRAGIVGPDGATHQGCYDIAFLRTVPNLVIMVPSDLDEQYRMLNTGYRLNHPAVVRFPRAMGYRSGDYISTHETIKIGQGRILNSGKKVAIAAFGPIAHDLYELCREKEITLADMRFVKPLDLAMLDELAKHHEVVLSVEEGAVQGGIGEEIARYFEERSYSCRVLTAGIPDEFEMEDSRSSILKRLKLDPEGILERVRNFLV
ncbi:MAG: 1-deoxy-D-xylulose-5-phosphate synthase [Succinatimonas sp.]|nr:1-deoxy-D-xylulose-5-phosphate synthase [Succinatimonas sp.]